MFDHFRRFRIKNTLHALYPTLHRAERERVGRNSDPSAALVDSQSVKTVEESGASAALTAASSSRAATGTSSSIPLAFLSPGT